MTTIGERLLAVRGKTKQGEFARALEINPNTLRNYENGRVLPNQEVLERVCVQFSVSPEWLLLGTGSMQQGPERHLSPPVVGRQQSSPPTCPRCTELYERLVQAQGREVALWREKQERETMLLKENAELRAEIAALETRLSLSAAAVDERQRSKTA